MQFCQSCILSDSYLNLCFSHDLKSYLLQTPLWRQVDFIVLESVFEHIISGQGNLVRICFPFAAGSVDLLCSKTHFRVQIT